MSFSTLDWLVLGLFMLALIGIVVWVAMQEEEDTEDYFLAHAPRHHTHAPSRRGCARSWISWSAR